ncbi:MAG: Crp/Fnr family transcriptional regulator [Pseudomonadota bacterium]|nr:Crp/Fnr family transcriptional regulator [Pseudomonadota bacterium]
MSAQASDKRTILANHEFFRGLPSRIIERLASHVRQSRYGADRRIFSKGDEGHGLLAVLSGVVKISVPSEDGKEIVLNLIGAGEVFGEIALLDGGARTADATALSDCEILVLDRRDVLPILMDEPIVCLKFLEVISRRLRRTTEQVEDLSFGEPSVRLAKALLRLAKVQGTIDHPRPRVAITQKELGHTIGLSRERTNWYLREWEKAGYLTLEKGGCVINERNLVAGLAERDRS